MEIDCRVIGERRDQNRVVNVVLVDEIPAQIGGRFEIWSRNGHPFCGAVKELDLGCGWHQVMEREGCIMPEMVEEDSSAVSGNQWNEFFQLGLLRFW